MLGPVVKVVAQFYFYIKGPLYIQYYVHYTYIISLTYQVHVFYLILYSEYVYIRRHTRHRHVGFLRRND